MSSALTGDSAEVPRHSCYQANWKTTFDKSQKGQCVQILVVYGRADISTCMDHVRWHFVVANRWDLVSAARLARY